MNEFEIITIENDESYVTIDTLVRFSGNGEEPIKALIRKYADKLEAKQEHFSKTVLKGNLKLLPKNNGGTTNWSKVRLNERQAMFLLTLMANSEQVVNFKDDMETEFYKYKNKAMEVKSPMQIVQEAIVIANEQIAKEKAAKQRALKMLNNASLIEYTNEDSNDDIPVEEFCKMLSDKYSVMIGRTMCYMILRELKLVMAESTKPSQRGLMVYLSYRKHERGYSTRVFVSKANKLSKYMLTFLVKNPEINDALGNPFDI